MLVAALAAIAWAAPAAAQGAPAVERSSPTIASVRIETLNVFDPRVPGEDWWPFQLADRIHVTTKEEVVRRELLLGPGDRYDSLKALESERNLRGLGFFRKAEVRPSPRPDGQTDLIVRTQDGWTTNLNFGAGTEGGENYFDWGASENNLLGYGKAISFLHSEKGPRRADALRYDDPRLLGSRFHMSPFYEHSNQGDSEGVGVVQPFFSVDTPDAMGSAWSRTINDWITYKDGEQYSKYTLANRTVQAGYGVRVPGDRALVQRLEAGWYDQRDVFSPTSDTIAGTLPAGRDMSGPTLGYSWIQPDYIRETYINRMERVEDFNLGNELTVFGGFMGQALGGDADRWIFNAVDQQGVLLLPGRFGLAQVGLTGRVGQGKWENTLLFTNANLFWKTTWLYPQTWVAHLEGTSGRRLDAENQVELGGENGLRGYRNHSFVGGRSVLLNLENRFFFPGEYFHLVRFGGAAFLDSGSVQPEGSGFSFERFQSDVGLGLRFSSTRSQSGDVVRLDVAYALNRGPGSPSRWVIALAGRQAFQIFNSSTQRVRQSPGSQLIQRTDTGVTQ